MILTAQLRDARELNDCATSTRFTSPKCQLSELFMDRPLGIDPSTFDSKDLIAPALKMVLDWRREHGYSIGKVPKKLARDICEAAFDADGVIEWLERIPVKLAQQ